MDAFEEWAISVDSRIELLSHAITEMRAQYIDAMAEQVAFNDELRSQMLKFDAMLKAIAKGKRDNAI